MLLVLTGKKGSGKKTICDLLIKTERFKKVTRVTKNPIRTKEIMVINPEGLEDFLGERTLDTQPLPYVIMCLKRNEETNEKLETLSHIVINNGDIEMTINSILESYEFAIESYEYWFEGKKKGEIS